MQKKKLRLVFMMCMLFFSLSFVACNSFIEKESQYISNSSKENQIENFLDLETEYYLENGYYTIGIDIPAGICNIYATSGTGSILYSADGTIETHSSYDDDLNQLLITENIYAEEIIDYTLKEGYTIHISGPVRAKVEFSKITGNYTSRKYDEKNKITLKSGNYTVGKDFEAGMYTITAIEGKGSVFSSNAFSLGIDELFGVYDGEGVYIQKAVNITLNEGDTLNVDAVTIELVKMH